MKKKVGIGLLISAIAVHLIVVIVGLTCWGTVFWGFEKNAYTITKLAFWYQMIAFFVGIGLSYELLVDLFRKNQTEKTTKSKRKFLSFLITYILACCMFFTVGVGGLSKASCNNNDNHYTTNKKCVICGKTAYVGSNGYAWNYCYSCWKKLND